ncbi:conserved hypothetical protein [Vibrio cholerae MO10]|uniref:Uncharacterized protein n=1 Tax=Vibrio cholerae (strain MO10) TaxID=345072 RepID=A0A0X1L2D6_VIBCO|nr:conserved hypothetical protein [Vibrio cholerae MO10]
MVLILLIIVNLVKLSAHRNHTFITIKFKLLIFNQITKAKVIYLSFMWFSFGQN